ncbi:MAG: bis(5'-nucleosyl)-tetraphosphatase (symmetrical) YqeK [Parafannyhessea sp.]|uniref:bis(5'-nucleosyl)-tetraphosphatase (symmetrical) YqeK n=1 Tax=Parafannyhessea sp. TaxID=2847324 RepID=UPI003F075770
MREPTYTPAQQAEIKKLEHDVTERMRDVKPRRLAHSLSVAKTAEGMALEYGVDPYLARVAGILHDWDKVVPDEELEARAASLGIDFGVDLSLVRPLLHGVVAARELPELYPELPREVFLAIARHTTGAADMTPLEEVVFVADGIEPLRKSSPGIERVRALVGKAPLDDVYYESFCGGLSYVIDTRRYLYPGTLDIYNKLVLRRAQSR